MFYLSATHAPPMPPTSVLEGVWDHFRAWKCIGAQGCVLLALGRTHSGPQSAPRPAKMSTGSQKLAFRPLWATLLEQIGEGAVFEINILFTMFSSHRATPGLSTIAPLTSLEAERGPEPAFLCPLAPTGAPKRRRRSP